MVALPEDASWLSFPTRSLLRIRFQKYFCLSQEFMQTETINSLEFDFLERMLLTKHFIRRKRNGEVGFAHKVEIPVQRGADIKLVGVHC